MPRSFEYMADDPLITGLCGYCNDISSSSHPVHGCVMCEGSHCLEAYKKYVDRSLADRQSLCDICAHSGYESMADVGAYNCCDGYEFYKPINEEDDDE